MDFKKIFNTLLRKKKDKGKRLFRPLAEQMFQLGADGDMEACLAAFDALMEHYCCGLLPDVRLQLREVVRGVVNCQMNYGEFTERQNSLRRALEAQSPLDLKASTWLDLQYLFIRVGLFCSSLKLRELALEALRIKVDRGKKKAAMSCFEGLVDASEYQAAEALMPLIQKRCKLEKWIQLQDYYQIRTGGAPYEELEKADTKYLELVEGKSVALVGPANSSEECGSEIDEFDLVVRIGYGGNNYDAMKQGTRTDISYYGVVNYNRWVKDGGGFLKDLAWSVYKKPSHVVQLQQNGVRNSSELIRLNGLFCGSPMMLPCAVFDLLHYKPASLKIFNSDFYLADNMHHVGYRPTTSKEASPYSPIGKEPKKSTGGFAHHDLMSQIRLMRSLSAHPKVELAGYVSKVLSMKDDEYLKGMEEIHTCEILGSGHTKNAG